MRMPSMSTSMPKSLPALLKEWRSADLDSFRSLKFPPSQNAMAQAYGKRRYLFDHIKSLTGEGQTFEESAGVLDRHRARSKVTLTAYYRQLVKDDDSIVHRSKRPRPNDTPPPARRPSPPPCPPAARPRPPAPRPYQGRGAPYTNNRNGIVGRRRVPPLPPPNPAFFMNLNIPWENTGHTSGGRFNR
jgi:hypothetical protein